MRTVDHCTHFVLGERLESVPAYPPLKKTLGELREAYYEQFQTPVIKPAPENE